jgi:hypothetical protein
MAPRIPHRYLPHGFEEKRTPDGRTYWIDYRPLPPSWLPPADVAADFPKIYLESDSDTAADVKTSFATESIKLPKGVQKHYTPSGSVYYVDSRPRATWTDPRTVDFNIDRERESFASSCEVIFAKGEFLGEQALPRYPHVSPLSIVEPPPEVHIEFRLLMDLTKWRVGMFAAGLDVNNHLTIGQLSL